MIDDGFIVVMLTLIVDGELVGWQEQGVGVVEPDKIVEGCQVLYAPFMRL